MLTFVTTQRNARIDLDSILVFFALHPCVRSQKKSLAKNIVFLLVMNSMQARSSINIVNYAAFTDKVPLIVSL